MSNKRFPETVPDRRCGWATLCHDRKQVWKEHPCREAAEREAAGSRVNGPVALYRLNTGDGGCWVREAIFCKR